MVQTLGHQYEEGKKHYTFSNSQLEYEVDIADNVVSIDTDKKIERILCREDHVIVFSKDKHIEEFGNDFLITGTPNMWKCDNLNKRVVSNKFVTEHNGIFVYRWDVIEAKINEYFEHANIKFNDDDKNKLHINKNEIKDPSKVTTIMKEKGRKNERKGRKGELDEGDHVTFETLRDYEAFWAGDQITLEFTVEEEYWYDDSTESVEIGLYIDEDWEIDDEYIHFSFGLLESAEGFNYNYTRNGNKMKLVFTVGELLQGSQMYYFRVDITRSWASDPHGETERFAINYTPDVAIVEPTQ